MELNQTATQDSGSLDALVRRYVVQEMCPGSTDHWYDDPCCNECRTLSGASLELKKDTEHKGHADKFKHRIIERTEREVSTNDQAQRPEAK